MLFCVHRAYRTIFVYFTIRNAGVFPQAGIDPAGTLAKNSLCLPEYGKEVDVKTCHGPKLTLLLFVVCLGGTLIGPAVLAGNIKRSCSAEYYGMVQSISFTSDGVTKTLNLPFETLNFRLSDYTMSAQGGCGKLVPNRCRKRARDKLLTCTKEHVASPNQLPTACGPDAFKRFQNTNLVSAIKKQTCGQLRTKDGIRISDIIPAHRQVQVLLGVHINGKDDCGKEKPGITTIDGKRYSIKGNKIFLSTPLKTFRFTCP
jgi:hypothetical protein